MEFPGADIFPRVHKGRMSKNAHTDNKQTKEDSGSTNFREDTDEDVIAKRDAPISKRKSHFLSWSQHRDQSVKVIQRKLIQDPEQSRDFQVQQTSYWKPLIG